MTHRPMYSSPSQRGIPVRKQTNKSRNRKQSKGCIPIKQWSLKIIRWPAFHPKFQRENSHDIEHTRDYRVVPIFRDPTHPSFPGEGGKRIERRIYGRKGGVVKEEGRIFNQPVRSTVSNLRHCAKICAKFDEKFWAKILCQILATDGELTCTLTGSDARMD